MQMQANRGIPPLVGGKVFMLNEAQQLVVKRDCLKKKARHVAVARFLKCDLTIFSIFLRSFCVYYWGGPW